MKIVKFPTRAPYWTLSAESAKNLLLIPTMQTTLGINEQGKTVGHTSSDGTITNTLPFIINWNLSEIDPEKINQPQQITGTIANPGRYEIAATPIQEIWILTQRPATWPPTPAADKQELPPYYYTEINLNTDNAETLAKIPYISLRTAKRIVEYRETTPFYLKLKDLEEVKGISAWTIGKIKANLEKAKIKIVS